MDQDVRVRASSDDAPAPSVLGMTWTENLSLGDRGQVRAGGAGTLPDTHPDAFDEHVTVTVDRRARRPVVVVEGELDASGGSLLEAVITHVAEQGAREPVLVDLGAVRFADTHGLSPVLDGTAEIRTASTAVRRVLRLLGIPDPRPPGPTPRRR